MRKFSEAIDSLKNGDVDWKEKVGSVTAAAGAKLGQAREAAKAGLEAAKASENGQKFLEATAAAGQRVGQARAAAGQRIETFKASENGQKIFEAAAAAGAKLGEVRERVGAVAAELVEAGDVAFVGDADAPLPVATPRGPLDPGWAAARAEGAVECEAATAALSSAMRDALERRTAAPLAAPLRRARAAIDRLEEIGGPDPRALRSVGRDAVRQAEALAAEIDGHAPPADAPPAAAPPPPAASLIDFDVVDLGDSPAADAAATPPPKVDLLGGLVDAAVPAPPLAPAAAATTVAAELDLLGGLGADGAAAAANDAAAADGGAAGVDWSALEARSSRRASATEAAGAQAASIAAGLGASLVNDVWRDELIPQWASRRADADVRARVLAGEPPAALQGMLWHTALDGASLAADDAAYRAVVARVGQLREQVEWDLLGQFREQNKQLCADLDVIEADVPRTFCADGDGDGGELRGTSAEELTALLQALLLADSDGAAAAGSYLGYVQGISYAAAFVLGRAPPWQSYGCLRALCVRPALRRVLALDPDAWEGLSATVERLLGAQQPETLATLRRLGIMVQMWLPEWLVPLWSRTLPPDLVALVWNLLLLDGDAALVLRATLATLAAIAPALGRCRDIADGRRALSQAPLALGRGEFVAALDGARADDADLAFAAHQ